MHLHLHVYAYLGIFCNHMKVYVLLLNNLLNTISDIFCNISVYALNKVDCAEVKRILLFVL